MSEFHIPFNSNKKLEVLISKVKEDTELNTLLRMSNVTAIDRLGFNDHGPTHIKIVANSSLRMLRILVKNKVVPNIVKDYNLENEDAEIVVVLASILHDIGHAVHRRGHELLSTVMSSSIINRLLSSIYKGEEGTIVKFEALHAIYSHESGIKPLTIEGGVMKVADALDMEKGRARIPYKAGSVNIHSISAMSIEKVDILEGTERPLRIVVHMSNPAGIFQVDELLKEKVNTSGIEKMLTIEAQLIKNGEEKVLKNFQF
ncbi:HD domain-containing protein [bacterium]|nr:HD domain-containing protein [bacterium]